MPPHEKCDLLQFKTFVLNGHPDCCDDIIKPEKWAQLFQLYNDQYDLPANWTEDDWLQVILP